MNLVGVECPITGFTCFELTKLEREKDQNPVTGAIVTSINGEITSAEHTEINPYGQVEAVREWATQHPEDCYSALGESVCGAVTGRIEHLYFGE